MSKDQPRREFTERTKAMAMLLANWQCARCGNPLDSRKPDTVRFNHRVCDYFRGDNDLDNCEPLCITCDSKQTYGKDIPAIAKSRRIRAREAGVRKPRSIRAWRRFNGERVYAPRERSQRRPP